MPTSLTPWRFARDLGIWVEDKERLEPVDPQTLTVLTFNVWFSRLWLPERLEAVLRIARTHDVDVLALQEVTPEFLGKALETEWVRDAYWTSDALGETVYPYGNLILTRIPVLGFTALALPSRMDRRLIVADLAILGGGLPIATVHLESIRENALVRARQLEIIQRKLRRHENVLLVGDFNFCSSWVEESDNVEPDFLDVWSMLKSDDPGYTMNTAVNAMERDVKQEHKQVRFDRVVLRSLRNHWRPKSIEIVGREPVSVSLPNVFPSDHFGLVVRLTRSEDTQPRTSA